LTEEDDAALNYRSPEYPASRAEPEEVPKEHQFYGELHDSLVDWTAKYECWIRVWRLSVTNIVQHDDFNEECREPYDALVEYQDSHEPGCEAHEEPGEFVRPLLAGRRVPTLAALERKRRDSAVELKSKISPVGVNPRTQRAPGSIPAAQTMAKDNASVSNAAARMSGGLMEHIRGTRDELVDDAADAVANAPSPKFLEAFLKNKKKVVAPSPKFLEAFLKKKAFMGAIKSSIQIPPGLLAVYSTVEDNLRDQDSDAPRHLNHYNTPGPVPIPGRVWLGSSNPEVSHYQHREQEVIVRDDIALTRPRNAAENRLMDLLHLPVSKADPMHRPRRE